MSNRLRQIWPIAAYILISLAATWPLVIRLHGWVPGFGDWGQNMWALWWTWKSLLVLKQSPFFTQYLFYPDGVTLLFHPLDVTDGLLALPLYSLLGSDITYNLLILLSFVLSGLGVYYLVLYLVHNRWAAFVAGLIFAFSPYHFLRLELGHLNLSSMQWIPFYLIFLFKFAWTGRLRFACLTTLFMALNALCSWYYVIACGLLSLAVLAWRFRESITVKHLLPRVALVLLLAVLTLLPLLGPMFWLLSSMKWIGEHDPLRHSVDLMSFWVPGPPSTWARWFEEVWISYAAQHREPGASAYLGYGVIGLSVIGLWGQQAKEALWWLIVGLGFMLLALGPQMQVDGHIFETKLPYHYFYTYVPGFSISGIPGRFVVMISLIMAILAGYGLSELVRRLPKRKELLSLVMTLVVSLEFLAVPVAGSKTELPDFYSIMAEDNQVYAVLDFKWDANYLLHAQVVHGKPLIGGWLARLPEKQARYLDQGSPEQVISYFLLQDRATTTTDLALLQQELNQSLTKLNVRYIIDHDDMIGQWLIQILGWKPVYEAEEENERIVVYSPAL